MADEEEFEDVDAKLILTGSQQGVNLPLELGQLPEHLTADPIRLAGQAAIVSSGEHAPSSGSHNWVFGGPHNSAGRIRAIAIHPNNTTIYAGSAQGGVWKSTDRGESWIPLFHAQTFLAVSAIAIAPSTPATVYAGTGERDHRTGAALYRSTDNGETWERVDGFYHSGAYVEAIAVHPTDANHVWLATTIGVFRWMGNEWHRFDNATHYSDAAFAAARAGAPTPNALYLARAFAVRGDIVRVEDTTAAPGDAPPAVPAVGTIRAQMAAATNLAQPLPAGPPAGTPTVTNAKFTIDTAGARMYVAYGGKATIATGPKRPFRAMFRCNNIQIANLAAGGPIVWINLSAATIDWQIEDQSDYNLCIAVSPVNNAHVFFGMVALYFSSDSGATWNHAMNWHNYNFVDTAEHADQHVLAYDTSGATRSVWVGNDGGISRCDNYMTGPQFYLPYADPGPVRHRTRWADVDRTRIPPPPVPTVRWIKRDHGILGTQPYDVTHSPLVPTLYGCGFQDLGTWVGIGGATWFHADGADGGFVAWDEFDPYRFLVNIQGTEDGLGGVARVFFGGRLLEDWPGPAGFINDFVASDTLTQGFLRADQGRFPADTVADPLRSNHFFTTRVNRLYRTRDGDRWEICRGAGRTVEILFDFRHGAPPGGARLLARLVVSGSAAVTLGMVAGSNISTTPFTVQGTGDRRHRVQFKGMRPGPYTFIGGDDLDIVAEAFEPTSGETVFREVHVGFIAATLTLDEVVTRIEAAITAAAAPATRSGNPVPAGIDFLLRGLPTFGPHMQHVEILSNDTGAAARINLGGSAAIAAEMGVVAGAYPGTAGRSASVTLLGTRLDTNAGGRDVPVADGHQLTIGTAAGPQVATITFNGDSFAATTTGVRAGELATAINRQLVAANVAARAYPTTVKKQIRIIYTPAPAAPAAFTLAGAALLGPAVPAGTPRAGLSGGDATLAAGARVEATLLSAHWGRYDLRPAAPVPTLTVTLAGAGAPLVTVTFPPAVFVDGTLANVTTEEVFDRIATALAAQAAFRVELERIVFAGEPTVVAFSRGDPNVIFAGGKDGSLFRSRDRGATWEDKTDPRFIAIGRPVEGIATHPSNTGLVYLVLEGEAYGNDPGMLFKSTDSGDTWESRGAPTGLRYMAGFEIDPDNADVLYAGTSWEGVIRSTNGGSSWDAFNQGLPAVQITDLSLETTTKLLRVATFGRGVWERHVGSLPAKNVKVYLRANQIDDGNRRPAPDGPDALGTTPTFVVHSESPDIKVTTLAAPGPITAGLEYDEQIQHVFPVPGAARVFVQVHNRGAFPAPSVRVVALWADADVRKDDNRVGTSPPDLDDQFWDTFSEATPTVNLPWHLIGVGTTPVPVVHGYPRTVALDVAWPVFNETTRIAILVLASSDDDELDPPADVRNNVSRLIETERKVALRVTPVRRIADSDHVDLEVLDPPGVTAFAGNLAGAFGFAVAAGSPRYMRGTVAGPFNLSAAALGGPPLLTITRGIARDVRPRLDDAGDLTSVSPDMARRVLNRALREARLPIRCQIGKVDLAIRSSPADSGERATSGSPAMLVGAGNLAEIATSDVAVAAGDQPNLFRLIGQLVPRPVRTTADDHYYVRVANLGSLDVTGVTVTLRWTDPAAAALALAAIAAPPAPLDIPAGEERIAEFVGHPTGLTGNQVLLYATVNHADDTAPADPADFGALAILCRARSNNAAWRLFTTA